MTEKRMNIEGSPESKMVQLIRKFGYNRDVIVEIGTVLSPLPELSVRLGSDGLVLNHEDLVVAEHLTDHKRVFILPETDPEEEKVSGKVTGGFTLRSLGLNEVEITIRSNVKKGDQVFVISDDNSQMYYVLDKVVV